MSSFDHVWGERQNNGGPAFPVDVVRGHELGSGAPVKEAFPGMSLRDYFATQAMQGICSHGDTWGLATSAKIAGAAYEIADAMLAERAK